MSKRRFVQPPRLPPTFLRDLDASWWQSVAASPVLRLWLELHATPMGGSDLFRLDPGRSNQNDSEDPEPSEGSDD